MRKLRARYDEFTSIMHEHWSNILQVINRQSPRVTAQLNIEGALHVCCSA